MTTPDTSKAMTADRRHCLDPICARPLLLQQIDAQAAEIAALREGKAAAYLERNQLVAFLTQLFPSGTRRTDIPGWNPEWHGCVYIDTPAGQLSWHYHDSHAHLFAALPPYRSEWDGHTTEQKYARLHALKGQTP